MTVTGFVVHAGLVALHWHQKLAMWLPAGGHIEANEDPVQAVLREINEEFGVVASVLPLAPRTPYAGGPEQLEPPHAMLDCIVAPTTSHRPRCYCRPRVRRTRACRSPARPLWVDAETLGFCTLPRGEVALRLDVWPWAEAIRQNASRWERTAPVATR